jgi:hypothetical protein
MRNTLVLLALSVALGIGCRLSYTTGYKAGHSQGYREGAVSAAIPKVPEQHHYELKEHGKDTILRLDKDTGNMCWIALSISDITNISQDVPKCEQKD